MVSTWEAALSGKSEPHVTATRLRDRQRARRWPFALAALWFVPAPIAGGESAQSQGVSADALQVARQAMGLTTARACTLSIGESGQGWWRVVVTAGDESFAVRLWPHSVRGDQYRLIVQMHDGVLLEAPPSPVSTVRGVAEGDGDSAAAGGFVDGLLYLLVRRGNGSTHFIEPLWGRAEGAGEHDYLLYDNAAAAGPAGVCATASPMAAFALSDDGATPRGPDIACAELACDADFEFFSLYGSVPAVEERISLLTSITNLQFESQAGLRHVLTAVIVRATPTDPYWGSNSDSLLCQFITEWTNNQQAISYDVAKLFTGRDILSPDPAFVGQAATIGDVCDRQGFCNAPPAFDDGAFCYSQSDCCGSLACSSDLMAHELGHLWGAAHCPCPNHTMNATLTCSNQFSEVSLGSIIAHRDSRQCLDDVPCAPAPVCGNDQLELGEECDDGNIDVGDGCNSQCQIEDNDICANALPVFEGVTPFSTFLASSDGPPLPASCDEGQGPAFGQDIWFCYAAHCSGVATVSLCGSVYDTRLAVYSDCVCPATNERLLACSDDYCGLTGRQSQVSVPLTAGQAVLIRVGGFGLEAGVGALSIVCGPAAGLCGNGVLEPGEQCDPPDGGACSGACQWVAPANDACLGAQELTCGQSVLVDNTLATPPANGGAGDPDLPAASPSCQWNGTPVDVHSTLWYSFTAVDTSVAVRTCGSPAQRDTIVALYGGACGQLVELACDDDGCGTTDDLTSRICVGGLTPGETYRLMVGNPGGWSGSTPGPIQLEITCPCPDIGTGLGACCRGDGTCINGTASACAAWPGDFQGPGSSCAVTPCGGACAQPLRADLSGDGLTDGRDMPLFVQAVLAASQNEVEVCSADFSGDGVVGPDDASGFVAILLAP